MPFWLYTPAFNDPSNPQSVTLSWGASFQLHQIPFSYDLDVNTTSTFDPTGAVLSQTGLTAPQVTVTTLPSGPYYWRVTARAANDPADNWQSDYHGPDAHHPVERRDLDAAPPVGEDPREWASGRTPSRATFHPTRTGASPPPPRLASPPRW